MKKRLNHYKRIWQAMETNWMDLAVRFLLPIIVIGIGLRMGALGYPLAKSSCEIAIETGIFLIILSLIQTGFDFLTTKCRLQEDAEKKYVVEPSTGKRRELT